MLIQKRLLALCLQNGGDRLDGFPNRLLKWREGGRERERDGGNREENNITKRLEMA